MYLRTYLSKIINLNFCNALIWSAVLSLRKQAQHRFVTLDNHQTFKKSHSQQIKSRPLFWYLFL
jgi:hypothetical protein